MTYTFSHTGLYTDLYELTMMQGYYLAGKANQRATFDYFFRDCPFRGGYVLFAGLDDLLGILEALKYEKDDLEYLRSIGFREEFLKFLSGFRFRGDVYSVREGEVIFPLEPVVRVEGTILETQLVETLVLNILNFESLIASKASRIRQVAGNRPFTDFGLRRAQGMGGIHASRAAVVGGADGTSNLLAGFLFSLKVSGTQAHSWVQGFEDELTSFRTYAGFYPDNCVLLVDSYNTLQSGVPNAVITAKEMEKNGRRLAGIRLDSGDLAYLSKRARAMLNEAGLQYVKIIASNQLDEYVIRSLLEQEAPIDMFGIGTRLVTGQDSAALDGVYKLCMWDSHPSLKVSDNYTKVTLPGIKKIIRYSDAQGRFCADGVLLDDEKEVTEIFHPFYPEQKSSVQSYRAENLLSHVMKQGSRTGPSVPAQESAGYAASRLAMLPEEHKRFEYPHFYKTGLSGKLIELRQRIVADIKRKFIVQP